MLMIGLAAGITSGSLLTGCGSSTPVAGVAVSSVSIATASLPAAVLGTAYSATITASDGVKPYSFSLSSGLLPAGFTLSPSGVLSGTPSVSGTYSFVISVTDATALKASRSYSFVIAPAAGATSVSITTASLASGTSGMPYNFAISAANGTAPYSFTVASGSLPAGLILSGNGTVSGTPTTPGTYTFTVGVVDAAGQRASVTYTLVVAQQAASPVTFTTTSLGIATAASPYGATILATGGTGPYTYSIASGVLPTGLTLSSAGVIAGTPTLAGSYAFMVAAVDVTGLRATTNFVLTVANATTPVSISTTSLPSGVSGTAYNASLAASGGTAPYRYAISNGVLPAGLMLASTGAITGSPSAAGVSSFTVTVTDANQQTAASMLSITIVSALTLPAAPLASAEEGAAYTASLTAANGTAPYTYSVVQGSLPAGLSLSSVGVITGTPTTAGTSAFSVGVTDAGGQRVTNNFSVTVVAKVSIVASTPPAGVIGQPYSAALSASNGTAPYSFTVASGSLPAGLTLSSTGMVSGTPTAAGTFSFTVKVTDANAQSAGTAFSITIAPALTLTTSPLGQAQTGNAYTATFFAANGTSPYTFAVTAGALPAGFTLTSAGVLSGTPTSAGTSAFTVTATDAAGQRASGNYSLTVVASLMLTTPALGPGQVGVAYQATFFAANGTAPYSFAVASGALPGGFTLASGGLLSGTPTAAGTSSFAVRATDANGAQATANYTLSVTTTSTLQLTTPALGPGQVGNTYNATFYAANGTAPYTFAVTSGALPAGFSLASSGYLSGTATTAGTAMFTVTAMDAAGSTGSGSYTLTINPSGGASNTPALTVNSTTISVPVNSSYSSALPISGGTLPYVVTLTSGSLPAGLTLSNVGVLSGTATATGTTSFTVSITDSSSPKLSMSVTFTAKVVDPAHATVQVDASQVLATVAQGAFGLHTSVYDDQLSDSTAVTPYLNAAGVSTLRYPGGSYSDRYHWAQNALTPIYGSDPGACGVLKGELYLAAHTDFGAFVKTLQSAGAKALITVNYGTSVANATATLMNGTDGTAGRCSDPNTAGQPQEAAAWVAYANGDASNTQIIGVDSVGFNWKTVGFWAGLRGSTPLAVDDGYNFLRVGLTAPLGIVNWELGNEMYYNGWDGNRNFEADLHAPFIYPNGYSGGTYKSRDQVAALSPTAYGTNAIQFIQAMKAVDPTIKIGLDLSSPGVDPIELTWNPDVMRAACAGTTFDIAIIHYYPGTYLDVKASEMLSLPQVDLPFVVNGIRAQLAQYCPANAASMKVFVTETSPNGTVNPSVPFAITGLFTLHTYLTGFETGIANLDWLELHNGTFLDASEKAGPSFYGYQMAHLLAAEGDRMVKATSSSSTVVAHATLKANGQKGVLLINADPSIPVVVQVSVGGASVGSAGTQYSYGVSTSQTGTTLAATPFTATGNTFSITVPAYTAIEVLLP